MSTEGNGQATRDEKKEGFWERCRTKCMTFLSSRTGKGALPALVVLAAGFLFARTPFLFGAYPLGIALLCANRRQTLPCFFGVILGACTLGIQGVVWCVLYMSALLMRLLFSIPRQKGKAVPDSKGIFGELVQMQTVVGALVAVAAVVYEMSVSVVDTATLLFAVTMLLACPIFTAVFSGFFSFGVTYEDVLGRRRPIIVQHARRERLWLEGAVASLLFFSVWGLREVSIFGLNLGYLLSAFSALYLARRFGAMRGCVAGLIVSMAASTLYAPAFGFLGLFTGALWQLGAIYAMGIGAGAGTIWSSYVGGLSGFLGVAPELWVAALISLPLLPRLYSDAIAEEVQKERIAAEDAVRAVEGHVGDADKLSVLSDAFDALSCAFAERRRTPNLESCMHACDEVCRGYCTACPGRTGCWDSEDRPASIAMETISERMADGSAISAGELPTQFLVSCTRVESMLADLRLASARLWRNAGRAGMDYPSPDYALTAELLKTASLAAVENASPDPDVAGIIRRRLAERGIRPTAVSVRGKRLRRIVIAGCTLGNKRQDALALLPAFEEACGCRLTPPQFELSGNITAMETHTREQFSLEVAYASRPAPGSEMSGDAVSSFASDEGRTYLLLSDGMGTGRAAARTAGACALFLEKMLSAGNNEEVSLKMLNRLVAVREDECAATVDLLSFDNCYGSACFIKSGAAASYIRRDGNLFRMRSRTIPLGIVDEVDAERTAFETKPGDVIIMLSDGISQSSEDAPWLIELLSHPLGTSLDTAAANILDKTVAHGKATDDMTVILARVTTKAS